MFTNFLPYRDMDESFLHCIPNFLRLSDDSSPVKPLEKYELI